jgi:uncharacterized protein YdiU (UPF0061 family)
MVKILSRYTYSLNLLTHLLTQFTDSLTHLIDFFCKDIELYLSGNKLLPGSDPMAHCYCGHQFGSFAGQLGTNHSLPNPPYSLTLTHSLTHSLGDGAAILLGEIINKTTNKRFEIQLKGAGLTPYSRTADGRKVLRSSIREYLCSEAMHHLNIPTTRALSCTHSLLLTHLLTYLLTHLLTHSLTHSRTTVGVTSDSYVQRDPFYDGTVIDERCTIVCRVAANFFRFGSFEIFKGAEGQGR